MRLGDGEMPDRLATIFATLGEKIREWQPTESAVEQVFMNNNAASALKLGQARGVAICACVINGLPVAEYSAKSVKQSVVGNGNATKTQVQHMVKTLLNFKGEIQADAADALAVALCHGHSRQLRGGIALQTTRRRVVRRQSI